MALCFTAAFCIANSCVKRQGIAGRYENTTYSRTLIRENDVWMRIVLFSFAGVVQRCDFVLYCTWIFPALLSEWIECRCLEEALWPERQPELTIHLAFNVPISQNHLTYSVFPNLHLQNIQDLVHPSAQQLHSISLPRRLRTRTPAHTPLIPTPLSQPLLSTKLQLPLQLRTWILPMNKIAKSTSYTSLSTIQSTTSLSEIRNGG